MLSFRSADQEGCPFKNSSGNGEEAYLGKEIQVTLYKGCYLLPRCWPGPPHLTLTYIG